MLSRRQELRRFYFGDLAPGESTERFLAAVGDVVAQRDELLNQLPHHQVHAAGAAAATGDMGAEEDEARFIAGDVKAAIEEVKAAADDALFAAEDALAAAHEQESHQQEARQQDSHQQEAHRQEAPRHENPAEEASVTGTPVPAPSPGGMQIR
jgi:hypothetical protein